MISVNLLANLVTVKGFVDSTQKNAF